MLGTRAFIHCTILPARHLYFNMKADKHVASIGIWEENMVKRSIYSSDKSDCNRGKKQMLAANYSWGENMLFLKRQNSFLFTVGKSSGKHVNMWKIA